MVSLKNVQWLSVKEVSELWEPELKIPASTIERELRYGLYKIEQSKSKEIDPVVLQQKLETPPPDKDLPSPDTLINRVFIDRFCDKEIWMLPGFWFDELPTGPSFPGRPSVMSAIAQELADIAKRHKLQESLAKQSLQLESWAKNAFPGKQTPKAKSIENGIRSAYRILIAEIPN